MDDNMDDNMLQLSQSQSTLISCRPITGLPTARPITEHLNFTITGSGEWSAEILFIFPENVTHPLKGLCEKFSFCENIASKCENHVYASQGWEFALSFFALSLLSQF